MQVDVAPSRAFPHELLLGDRRGAPEFRQEIDEIGTQKEGEPRPHRRRRQRRAEVPALRYR